MEQKGWGTRLLIGPMFFYFLLYIEPRKGIPCRDKHYRESVGCLYSAHQVVQYMLVDKEAWYEDN